MKTNHKHRLMAFAFATCSLLSAAGSAAVFAQEETETPVQETPVVENTAEESTEVPAETAPEQTAETEETTETPVENTEETTPEIKTAPYYFFCVDEAGNLIQEVKWGDYRIGDKYLYRGESPVLDGYEVVQIGKIGYVDITEGRNGTTIVYRKITADAETPVESVETKPETETPAETETVETVEKTETSESAETPADETAKTETAEGTDKETSAETEKAAESKTETAGTTASGTKTDTKAAASTGSASSSAKKNSVNTAAGGELAMFSALGTSAIAAVTAMIKARKAKGRF
jgi:hypothetical protein